MLFSRGSFIVSKSIKDTLAVGGIGTGLRKYFLTRNDGTGDPDGSAVVHELLERRSLEEKLGYDEVGPGVDLLLQHHLKF